MRHSIPTRAVLLLGFVAGCASSPAEPTGFGVRVALTYHSVVPTSLPWPAEICGTADRNRRPAVVLNWTGSEIVMEQDQEASGIWHATAVVPPNVRLDVSVRDPGLCRLSVASYGEFAWSGLAVNDVPVRGTVFADSPGRPPCFVFRVDGDGEVIIDEYL